ncbi:MAG TPA: formate dehydrogenase subunit gamma [Xanthobacteraceae bacterium]|nr:formate dehydrogenase subunit gamma [Xanthobacteraceae bacterium]
MLGIRAITRLLFAALLLIAAVAGAQAQAPSPTDPDGNAVREEQLLHELYRVEGRINIPNTREHVLIQPAGRGWQTFHEVILNWIAVGAIAGMIGLLAAFYLLRGRMRIEAGRSGRLIERFKPYERFLHWMTAISFVTLALTGLNFTFGKKVLLPLIGPDAYSTVAEGAKYVHNAMSFPFVIGVTILFVLWARHSLPTAADIEWIREGGGFVGSKHPPAWKFNAGQKLMFWGIVGAAVLAAVSGYVLIFPFYLTNIAGMQLAEIVHGVVAMIFIAAILFHIYIGTLGMEGGFEAMATGQVDLNWAKQHHSLWLEKELAKGEPGEPPGEATPAPAE